MLPDFEANDVFPLYFGNDSKRTERPAGRDARTGLLAEEQLSRGRAPSAVGAEVVG